MSDPPTAVVIVGGGIAGLTVAYQLHRLGVSYRLIEQEQTPGGKIRTETIDGFTIEGGPDAFLAEKPWARELCEELGLADDIIGTNDAQRRVFVVSGGRLRLIPENLFMLMPARPVPLFRSGLISTRGSLRAAAEPFMRRGDATADESVGSFVRRRFGDEVHEKLVDPLLSGIYAGDSDQLSLESTFPRLREMEQKFGSITRAARATGKKSSGSPAFLSLRGGLSQLVEALTHRLDPASVLLGSPVSGVIRAGIGYEVRLTDGQSFSADALVLATPAFVSARLVRGFDSQLATLLDQIRYVSTATISLAYRGREIEHPLDGHGFVVPRVERRRVTACTWVSTKLPLRVPEEGVLLRCFAGRAGDEDWVRMSDPELVELARDELRKLMNVAAEPLFSRVFRWERSMPQYSVGHKNLLKIIEARLADYAALYLTGSAYRGVGLPDCIRDAREIASRVAARLA